MEKHNIDPVFDEHSRILILGSFPSVKSRQQKFFYGHPQNRFWKVIAAVTGYPVPESVEEKKRMLLENGIAVWDVIGECDISGSADSSIRNVVPNDLKLILDKADIRKIFCNGTKSYELYEKYIQPKLGIAAVKLPSTSPANAQYQTDSLTDIWKQIVDFL